MDAFRQKCEAQHLDTPNDSLFRPIVTALYQQCFLTNPLPNKTSYDTKTFAQGLIDGFLPFIRPVAPTASIYLPAHKIVSKDVVTHLFNTLHACSMWPSPTYATLHHPS